MHWTETCVGLRAQAFDTGRLVANRTFLRGEGFRSLLRRAEPVEFPVLAYLVEHPEGPILVDTGLGADPPRPRTLRGFPPLPAQTSAADLPSAMRERGLAPEDVRTVVLTHLDWDHTGGLRHFPDARVLVHRPELEFARTRLGRMRFGPPLPAAPIVEAYDLDPVPFGPFPASRAVTEAGDVRLVPLPGHSPGQVAVACEDGDVTLLFAADHALRADWFAEDVAAGRPVMLGAFGKRDAKATSRRLAQLCRERAVVLLPSHDEDAPARLARREVTAV